MRTTRATNIPSRIHAFASAVAFAPAIAVAVTVASSAVAFTIAFASAIGALAGPALPTGFVFEPVALGPFASDPVGFADLPDGRLFLVERAGDVRLSVAGADSSVLLLAIPGVTSADPERGLVGVTVDPGWPARPYLYFYYTHDTGFARITLYAATGALADPASTALSLGSPYHLLTDIPDASFNHQAGTLRFGPDGMLYASLGDDGLPCQAQNRTRLAGEIVRLDVTLVPGAGSGPPSKAAITPADNPFSGLPNEQLVWAWGLRNPFRFTIDPVTGDLFVGDVGSRSFEEVDWLEAAAPGANFGWPQFEGFVPFPFDTCGESNAFTDPIWVHPHGVGLFSVIPGPRYRTVPGSASSYPAEYDGSLFVTDVFGGWIRRLEDAGGSWQTASPVTGQPSADHWAEGLGSLTDFQQGATGELLVMRFAADTPAERGVYRIAPAGASGAGDAGAGGAGAEGVAQAEPGIERAAVVRGVPNPSRGGGMVALVWSGPTQDFPEKGTILEIRDVAGRLVRSLPAGSADGSGRGTDMGRRDADDPVTPRVGSGPLAIWDTRDRNGRPVASGVYFVRLKGPGSGGAAFNGSASRPVPSNRIASGRIVIRR